MMDDRLGAVFLFGGGVAIGAAVGAVCMKLRLEKKYKQRTEEAIADAKARYLAVVKRESAVEEVGAGMSESEAEPADILSQHREVNSLDTKGFTHRTEADYTSYDKTMPPSKDVSKDEKNAADGARMTANAKEASVPFAIGNDEFGEDPLYDVSPEYNYYRQDGVLEDMSAGGEIVDNQEAVLGAMLPNMPGYEQDWLYLQDDAHNRYITVRVFNAKYTDYN